MRTPFIAGLALLVTSCAASPVAPLVPSQETSHRHQMMHEALYKLPRESRKEISDTYFAIASRLPAVQPRTESCDLKIHWQELFPYCFDGTLDACAIDEIQIENPSAYELLLKLSAEVDQSSGKHLYSP